MYMDLTGDISMQKIKELVPFLMFTFTVSSVIGFIYEEICGFINEGEFFKRGTTFGPWIPIYGVGCLLILALTHKVRSKPLGVFIISSVSCGLLELLAGLYFDKVMHIRLWDYSNVILNFGNVNGYICLRSVITWGLMALLFVYCVLPLCEKFRSSHPGAFNITAISLFAIFAADIVLSLTLR